MRFEFATAARIIFGPGAIKDAAPLARDWGDKALVVTGRSGERAAPLMDALKSHGISVTAYPVSGEPTTDTVLTGAALACKRLAALPWSEIQIEVAIFMVRYQEKWLSPSLKAFMAITRELIKGDHEDLAEVDVTVV
ncbi:MAG: iron-containing alcohol dehydrogenase [Deltaproteobacteria bacterium]|nr:iron-containing alcohol dehydrogenase [Deltaproteobacteria bacterium]MBF0524293.1 iron-containing alcohol dehydrogenase [Deltaproteobacteria bacterium]